MSQQIYDLALRYLGVAETPGQQSNPLIAEMFKTAPSWLDQDDSKTAWCGIFRGYLGLWCGTGVPKEHYRARKWLEWGQEVKLKDAKRGDTVVTSRDGGHHVALFDRLEGGRVYLLGGNQGNRVSIAPFPPSVIQGVRREA
ncbi:TIGR02594 family protein [Verrucomicrobium spinosum]|nr:TIGR02594 family protein [Verrucomicrobium spinosum]